MKAALTLTPEFRSALVLAVIQQAAALILSFLISEATPLLMVWAFTLLAFWAGVVIVAVRRPSRPSPTDVFLIKFGFIPLFIGACYLVGLIWRARGAL